MSAVACEAAINPSLFRRQMSDKANLRVISNNTESFRFAQLTGNTQIRNYDNVFIRLLWFAMN